MSLLPTPVLCFVLLLIVLWTWREKGKKNLYKLTNSESPFRTIFLEKRQKGKKKWFPQIQDRSLDCWRSRYARPDILAPPASLIYIKVSLNILWFCSSGGHRPQIHWRCTVRFPLSLSVSLFAHKDMGDELYTALRQPSVIWHSQSRRYNCFTACPD